MKRKLSILGLVLSGIMLLYSCKRDSFQTSSSTELAKKVIAWLDEKGSAMSKDDQKKILSLKENLDFNSLYEEPFNEKEKFIVIPVKNSYQPFYNRNKSNNFITNLLLSMSDSGFNKGNIVQYMPADVEKGAVPKSTFYKIYNHEKLDCDGRFMMLNLSGKPVYELQFKNRELQSVGIVKDKKQIAATSVPKDPISTVCTDWYLVTTYYYTDGHTETTEEYLYTTCTDGSAGGGGGGSDGNGSSNNIEYEYETLKSAKRTWYNVTIFGDWAFINVDVLANARFNNRNSAKNRFTAGTLSNFVFYHMSLGSNPKEWGTVTEISSFAINSNTSVTTHLKGYVTDPFGNKSNFDASKGWGLADFSWY